jgi:predicted nucleic acid-binding protein
VIVLDASALVDTVLDRPHGGWVLNHLEDADVVAPAHQVVEVVSALARLRRAGLVSDRVARAAMHDATSLVQELVVPAPAHAARAYALRERIRVSHGLYVALAEERGCPVLTTDRRLAAAAAPCEVLAPPSA